MSSDILQNVADMVVDLSIEKTISIEELTEILHVWNEETEKSPSTENVFRKTNGKLNLKTNQGVVGFDYISMDEGEQSSKSGRSFGLLIRFRSDTERILRFVLTTNTPII